MIRPSICLVLFLFSFLWWWLALFIEALVHFPNIEREGSQPWRANLKGGQLVQAILTKVVFACEKLWW